MIHIDNPHPKSRASYYLLREYLSTKDEDYKKDQQIRFFLKQGKINKTALKEIFFKRIYRKYGSLVCEYCGKRDLIRVKSTIGQHNIATVDHKVPISEGGLKYAFSNWICACWLCNFQKDNKRAIKTNKGYLII